MADNLIYIPNDDTQNYPIYGLQSMVKTFGHSRTDKVSYRVASLLKNIK